MVAITPGTDPRTKNKLQLARACGSRQDLCYSEETIPENELPIVVVYNGMHYIAPTRSQSKEKLMESKVIGMLEHVNLSIQMFNQIELPDNCKALEQAFNILETNLISIKDYINTPICPSVPIDGILNTPGLGVGKAIVSSGATPDIPLRHLNCGRLFKLKMQAGSNITKQHQQSPHSPPRQPIYKQSCNCKKVLSK